jgi:hypothetical protein
MLSHEIKAENFVNIGSFYQELIDENINMNGISTEIL